MKKAFQFFVVFLLLQLSRNIVSGQYIVSTIAGTGTSGYSGDGGAATLATLTVPGAGAVDKHGNIYLSDVGNIRIREIFTTGEIITVAGNGTTGFMGDGGPATAAEFSLGGYGSIAVDTNDNLFICDYGNYRIRKVNSSGIISTYVGTGVLGFSGDGGAASAASIDGVTGITTDKFGNLYFVDGSNFRIRKVNAAGIVTTVLGNGTGVMSGDGGPATAATLQASSTIHTDSAGNVCFIDLATAGGSVIRKIDRTGYVNRVIGSGAGSGFSGDGGPATAAIFYDLIDFAVDTLGDFYLDDADNYRIRKIDVTGTINTIAGTGGSGFSGDGGPATDAKFTYTAGVSSTPEGVVYVADMYNNRLRQLALCNLPVISPIGPESPVVCVGVNISLSDTVGGGSWVSSATGTAIVGTNGIVTGVAAGSAVISYSIANTCGMAIATQTVVVESSPAAGVITGKDSLCAPSALDTLHETVTGGAWVSGQTALGTIIGAGILLSTSDGLDTIYYITTNVCGSDSALFPVEVGMMCVEAVSNAVPMEQPKLELYPNPSSGGFYLFVRSATSDPVLITIRDLPGRQVVQQSIVPNSEVRLHPQLSPGMYLLNALIDGTAVTSKLLVE